MFPRPRYIFLDDCGMASVEYAVGLLVAAAIALVLLSVVQSGAVEDGLRGLVERALNVTG